MANVNRTRLYQKKSVLIEEVSKAVGQRSVAPWRMRRQNDCRAMSNPIDSVALRDYGTVYRGDLLLLQFGLYADSKMLSKS